MNEGLLEVHPGTGTVVARPPESTARARARLLANEVEQLVVEAKKLAMSLEDVTAALADHWRRLDSRDPPVASRQTAEPAGNQVGANQAGAKGARTRK